jgi:hypothetical protein
MPTCSSVGCARSAAIHRRTKVQFGLRRGNRRRGSDEEHDRPIGRQSDLARELITGRRRSLEPSIERLGPGDNDACRVDAVELHRFRELLTVPDGNEIGTNPDQALCRQVVPAGNARRRRDAERLRGFDQIRLPAARSDQRGDEHGVGFPRLDEPLESPVARNRAFAQRQQRDERARHPGRRGVAAREKSQLRRYHLAHPLPQVCRLSEFGMVVADVIDRAAQGARHVLPDGVVWQRCSCIVNGDTGNTGQRFCAFGLLLRVVEDDIDVMTSCRKAADG